MTIYDLSQQHQALTNALFLTRLKVNLRSYISLKFSRLQSVYCIATL